MHILIPLPGQQMCAWGQLRYFLDFLWKLEHSQLTVSALLLDISRRPMKKKAKKAYSTQSDPPETPSL